MATKQLKHRYVQTLGIIVMVLALVRCIFPSIAPTSQTTNSQTTNSQATNSETPNSLATDSPSASSPAPLQRERGGYTLCDKHKDKNYTLPSPLGEGLGVRLSPHPIKSVPSYAEAFPDSNHVQLLAAEHWGVKPVRNRADAEQRKDELVFMALSPYYSMAHLDSSIPYLVPRAAILLEDIGRTFFDSLQVKGLPLHRMVVSSVLRTEADVRKLKQSNKNATERSCHLYGTTFDINYNQYTPVVSSHKTTDDKLKYVLSEVLRDMRQQGRCYIKYEVHQPCFHITVR